MRRVRSVLAIPSALILVLALAAPAAAGGKPERFAAPADPLPLPGGNDGVCAFPVLIDNVVDRSHGLAFPPDRNGTARLTFNGYVLGRVTNLDTGKSALFPSSATVSIYDHADGSVSVTFAGPIFAYYFEADESVSNLPRGLWHVRGHGGERYGADGTLLEARAVGQVTDVCALLAP